MVNGRKEIRPAIANLDRQPGRWTLQQAILKSARGLGQASLELGIRLILALETEVSLKLYAATLVLYRAR